MPARSIITTLPTELRAEFDEKLINSGFSNYQGLADWLTSKGFSISKSAAHRYGQKFEARLEELREATQQALALAEACGDDENALGDALTRLTQMKAYQALMAMSDTPEKMSLTSLGRMVADLNRSSVSVKKHMMEVRAKLDERMRVLEAEGQSGKLDPETLRRVREEVYGLF